MASQKRKRQEGAPEASTGHEETTATTRRATRQNPAASDASTSKAASNDGHQRRSGRLRGSALEDASEAVISHPKLPAGNTAGNSATTKSDPEAKTTSTIARPATTDASKPTRTTKRGGAEPAKKGITKYTRKSSASVQAKPPTESKVKKHAISTTKALAAHEQPHVSNLPSPQSQQQLPRSPHVKHTTPQLPSRSSALRTGNPPSASISTPKRRHPPDHKRHTPKPPPTPGSDRNIDKIVLGNISFRAWYPSYYGKEVLGEASGNTGAKDHHHTQTKIGGGKREPPMLPMLYVCPCCFKYSKEPVMWREHVKFCERRAHVPGTKIYTHPSGVRGSDLTELSDPSRTGSKVRRKGGSGGVETHVPALSDASTTKTLPEGGEWSVWEVDGEKEGLFCQNLSLFAKLFLDNKSVFFDTSTFNYFLLVYTPPPPPNVPSSPTPDDETKALDDNPDSERLPYRPHILGFFSKEKMSWDNNNLACILVFPPWQRKGLGALLMGVSYGISRREGVLGGPEKPISELGRKGYKRFWASEIARWLLDLDVPPPALEQSHEAGSRSGSQTDGTHEPLGNDEMIIDIDDCSRATWIVPEDCMAVLREMGVAVETSPGRGKESSELRRQQLGGDEHHSTVGDESHHHHHNGNHQNHNHNNRNSGTPAPSNGGKHDSTTGGEGGKGGKGGKSGKGEPLNGINGSNGNGTKEESLPSSTSNNNRVDSETMVRRVRIDKAAIRAWLASNKIKLDRTCDPEGFMEGYALGGGSVPREDDDDDEDGEEEEDDEDMEM